MPTTTEIAAAANQFVAASNKAHAIVNGPASGTGSLVEVASGDVRTHARQQAEFEAALADLLAVGSGPLLTALGITSHANLAAANVALTVGKPFFNLETSSLDITTA